MAKKQITRIVKEFIKAIQQRDIKVEATIVFGSYAQNRANENSDIDIAVISPDFGKDFLRESVLLKKISMSVDYDISPRPYSLEEYHNAKKDDFLYQEIIKKGKIIPV
jgi:uncharacterized protein